MFIKGKLKVFKSKRVLVVFTLLSGLLLLLFFYTNCTVNQPGRQGGNRTHVSESSELPETSADGGQLVQLFGLGYDLHLFSQHMESPIYRVYMWLSNGGTQMSLYFDDGNLGMSYDGLLPFEFHNSGGTCGEYNDNFGSVRIIQDCSFSSKYHVQDSPNNTNDWYYIGYFDVQSNAELPIGCTLPTSCQ